MLAILLGVIVLPHKVPSTVLLISPSYFMDATIISEIFET